MNRPNKTESAVFQYCRFSLLLKDPFFQILLWSPGEKGLTSCHSCVLCFLVSLSFSHIVLIDIRTKVEVSTV